MSRGVVRPGLAGGVGPALALARVLRLSPAVLQPPNAAVSMNRAPSAVHRCELFGLNLYAMRPQGHGARAVAAAPLLGPPWLPSPPARETHEARHMRRHAAAARDAVPLVPAAVLISKKRVHKHAVVRNRCRTRLMAALQAVAREVAFPVVPGHAYVFFGTAHLYHVPMDVLQAQVGRAMAAVASKASARERRQR
ncbi:Uncharacterized protein MSYG_2905 [Malassezia sympodialis ATCC 42132]|uniref:Uncharacterized protein n=1 Tax=Malassezia sympodialis (strain ATCC 42132) TaxID=1230383 RepID=A0A1M8A835_MALS4|nr:Uncharacterized protein MSYG_2905 [Malassezia sympodialis ATCC 42132]